MLKSTIAKAIRKKVFDKGTIDGDTVAAVDGTKLFGSYVKHCRNCLSTVIKGRTHYYHSGAVMSTMGKSLKLVVGFEMHNPRVDPSKKDEGETNVAKWLLSRVLHTHKNLIDVVASIYTMHLAAIRVG